MTTPPQDGPPERWLPQEPELHAEHAPPPRDPTPPEQWNSEATTPATPLPVPLAEPLPEGVTFDRHTEHNRRAVIGIVLSGLAFVGMLVWFVGLLTPVLAIVALAIGGVVMGLRGRAAARKGLATNGTLGLAAAIMGVLALLGIIGIYALLLYALSQWG